MKNTFFFTFHSAQPDRYWQNKYLKFQEIKNMKKKHLFFTFQEIENMKNTFFFTSHSVEPDKDWQDKYLKFQERKKYEKHIFLYFSLS